MTNKKEPKTYIITEDVLSRIRETVGSQIPETGGILGSSDGKHVDHFYFDVTASVTGATYEPDCDKLNLIIQKWYEKGIEFVGFIHSHPRGAVKPSDPDNLYTTKIMKAFEMEWFVSLAKQIIEMGFEYSHAISYVSPGIMQEAPLRSYYLRF